MVHHRGLKMQGIYFRALLIQLLTTPFLALWSLFFWHHIWEDKQLTWTRKRPYILVANHISHIDPFVIQMGLPMFGGGGLLPFTCMASNRFMEMPGVGHFLYAIGAFPAKPSERMGSGVDEAVRRSRAGFTISLFPQGGIRREVSLEAKWGVINIAEQLPEAEVVPIYITRQGWHYRVVIGRSFIAQGLTPSEVMERIYALEPYAGPMMAPPKHSSLR